MIQVKHWIETYFVPDEHDLPDIGYKIVCEDREKCSMDSGLGPGCYVDEYFDDCGSSMLQFVDEPGDIPTIPAGRAEVIPHWEGSGEDAELFLDLVNPVSPDVEGEPKCLPSRE
jgi:hypothetical protein